MYKEIVNSPSFKRMMQEHAKEEALKKINAVYYQLNEKYENGEITEELYNYSSIILYDMMDKVERGV